MTEEEIKLNFITPAIERTWPKNCIRMEFPITKGRIMIDGKKAKRGKAYFADYLLFYSDASLNFPLAVVEAKDNSHSPFSVHPSYYHFPPQNSTRDFVNRLRKTWKFPPHFCAI